MVKTITRFVVVVVVLLVLVLLYFNLYYEIKESLPSYDHEQADMYYQNNRKFISISVKQRMDYIRKYCKLRKTFKNHNLAFKSYNHYRFQLNTKPIAWCPVLNSNDTLWEDYFIAQNAPMARKFDISTLEEFRQKPGHYIPLVLPHEYEWDAGKVPPQITFAVTAHPLSRLVNHYLVGLNILQDNNFPIPNVAWEWIVSAITRERTLPQDTTKEDIFKFSAELRYYWDFIKNKNSSIYPINRNNPFMNPPVPTFVEFIDYIIHSSKRRDMNWIGSYDAHWYPASQWCDICQHNFTYIIKLENYPGELLYLIEKLQLQDQRDYFLNHYYSKGSFTNELPIEYVHKYIHQLRPYQKLWLKEAYKFDFDMLQYSDSLLYKSKLNPMIVNKVPIRKNNKKT